MEGLPTGWKPASQLARSERAWYKFSCSEARTWSRTPKSARTVAPEATQPLRRELRSWGRDLVIALSLAIVIIIFFYQPVKVEGTSMTPLISDQERIFINKFVYRFEPIERGDVVVFWYPLDRSKSFIKRVVGLPGDTVEIRDGQVYVNGKLPAGALRSAGVRRISGTYLAHANSRRANIS